jgi:vancomycin resistance protein YoaR
MDIFISAIIWGMVIYFVLKFIELYLKARNDILREDLEAVSKKIKETIVNVNIERHGDMFYVFEKETDNFVAQGKTMAEIKEVMQKRFPKKTFVATEDHIKESGLEI